jgi:hypothetical protein
MTEAGVQTFALAQVRLNKQSSLLEFSPFHFTFFESKEPLMVRAFGLAMITALFPLGFAFADEKPDPRGNAALKYWQAFATLPKFTEAENAKINECLTTPLDSQTRELLTNAQYSLQMLQRGAALSHCDWGMSYEDGVYALLPHAQAARVLTSLACLRGRLRFEAGQNAEAIDDLFAAMILGRQVSLDRSLLSVLVGYGIEQRATETLAAYLPRLDSKTTKELKTRLDALPPFGTISTGLMTCEKETMEWFIRKVKETKNKEDLLAFLGWVGISEGKDRADGDKAGAFLQECGGTADGIIKFAEAALPSYAATAKMLMLPLAEFEKQFKAESARQSGNPVYKVFFPAIAKVRRSKERADVRRALLAAAIAVQLDGPDALKFHPDPAAGAAFEYAPFQGGFVLRSKLKDDKPVTLTVGRRS